MAAGAFEFEYRSIPIFMLVSSSRNVLLSLIYYIKINPHHFLKNRILGLVINLLKIHREKYIEKDPFQAIFQFFSCLSRGTQRLASIIRLLVEWNINVWCCCYYNSTKKSELKGWKSVFKVFLQDVFKTCPMFFIKINQFKELTECAAAYLFLFNHAYKISILEIF